MFLHVHSTEAWEVLVLAEIVLVLMVTLSFSDSENLLFNPHVTYRMWVANISPNFMKFSHLSESASEEIKRT